jgi:HK97 gp10 family phage protein
MITVKVSGLEEVQRNLKMFPQISQKHYAQAVTTGAQKLRDTTKTMPPVSVSRTGYNAKGIPVAPKYGGTMRQSITTRKIALLASGVFVGGNAQHYGIYVHEGTYKMKARPFFEWSLYAYGALKKIDALFKSATDAIARELVR